MNIYNICPYIRNVFIYMFIYKKFDIFIHTYNLATFKHIIYLQLNCKYFCLFVHTEKYNLFKILYPNIVSFLIFSVYQSGNGVNLLLRVLSVLKHKFFLLQSYKIYLFPYKYWKQTHFMSIYTLYIFYYNKLHNINKIPSLFI